MDREFIRMHEFEKQCKNIGLNEDDVREIECALLTNPSIGAIIKGTGGIRKFRYALSNRGKSGGARVIYIDLAYYEKIYLITVYAKSDMGNLSPAQCNELKALVKLLESELVRKG